MSSRPVRTVEPVVVIAETDSKRAWANVMSRSEKYSGTAPATEKTAHKTLTSRKPIRLVNAGGGPRVAMAAVIDSPPTIAAQRVKRDQSSEP